MLREQIIIPAGQAPIKKRIGSAVCHGSGMDNQVIAALSGAQDSSLRARHSLAFPGFGSVVHAEKLSVLPSGQI